MNTAGHFAPPPYVVTSVPTSAGSCHQIGPLLQYDGSAAFACIYADRMRLGIDDQCADAIRLRATAHLFSAAPELLDVLQDIVSDGIHSDVVPHLHRKALAAIAKALGVAYVEA